MFNPILASRRQFIANSSASVALALNCRAVAASWQPAKIDPVTAKISLETMLKFNPDGTPRPFAGNTLICHLPAQSRMRDAVTALGDALRRSSFAFKLACLPPDSYHMTVFSGPTDIGRSGNSWPSDIDIKMLMIDCNRIVSDRIRMFRMNAAMPIRMRATGERSLGSLRLEPTDATQAATLHRLRDRLADDVFRFRDKDHATYVYHTTLAYQLAKLTVMEEVEHQAILARYMPAILDVGSFELGIPEYCTFETMYRFEPVALLRT